MVRVVLSVTDSPAIESSLRAALGEHDLLLNVHNLDEAVRKLISIRADVAVFDDKAGVTRDDIVRLREASPGLPIIVLTTRGDEQTRADHLLIGAQDSLRKPFSYEELQRAIGEAGNHQTLPAPTDIYAHEPVQYSNPVKQHQTALRWVSRLTGHIKDPARLAESLVYAVTDTLDVVRCAAVLEGNGNAHVAAWDGIPDEVAEDLKLTFSSGIMRWFEERMSLIDRDAPNVPAQAFKELKLVGARLGVPLICRGRVCGALLVGDKVSGAAFTGEERELLTTIARCASVSLENAQYYERMSTEQSRLDTVLTSITAGVVVVDPQKRVTMLNTSAEQILRLRAADLRGRSVQRLGSGFADVVLRVLQDRKARLRQEVRDAASNQTIGLSVTPLPDGGAVIVFSHIPDEKAEEDIVYSPFWEYLATRVAQEVKNPMVAINTFAQLLPRKYESEEFRSSFSEVVQREISRINRVVDTLNEFARRPQLVTQRADLNETVQSVLKSFQEDLESRAIEVEATWDPEKPEADLDPIYFSQALYNVLQNSIEAMPKGGKLRIGTRRQKDAYEVTVSDTGAGVSDQDAGNVFLPFFSTKEKGMGLGLTLANRIMRQHEGDLTMTSDEEGGSAFALRIPIGEVNHADHSSR